MRVQTDDIIIDDQSYQKLEKKYEKLITELKREHEDRLKEAYESRDGDSDNSEGTEVKIGLILENGT